MAIRSFGSFEYNDNSGWCRWWCPGCERPHKVRTGSKSDGFAALRWPLDGLPSIKTTGDIGLVESQGNIDCVCYIREGQIVFVAGRTSHQYAGQRVDIPQQDGNSQQAVSATQGNGNGNGRR